MATITHSATGYSPTRAIPLAAEMQAGDPDWTYTATNPDGSLGPFSKIRIEDEDGVFVEFA